jgi:hypothetical protein
MRLPGAVIEGPSERGLWGLWIVDSMWGFGVNVSVACELDYASWLLECSFVAGYIIPLSHRI